MAGGTSKANQRQGRTRKRQYDNYRNENRLAKNKCRKLLAVVKRNPTDTDAKKALIAWGKQLGKDYTNAA
jgi:pyruvate/2-oxoacid:ferredoxin oxidoreductase alpha subunit